MNSTAWALAALVWCVGFGLLVGATSGAAFGVAVAVIEGLAVAILAAAVYAGWRAVAGLAALLGLAVVAAPIACVSAQTGAAGAGESSCTSIVGLSPAVGLPLLLPGPVAVWTAVSRSRLR